MLVHSTSSFFPFLPPSLTPHMHETNQVFSISYCVQFSVGCVGHKLRRIRHYRIEVGLGVGVRLAGGEGLVRCSSCTDTSSTAHLSVALSSRAQAQC